VEALVVEPFTATESTVLLCAPSLPWLDFACKKVHNQMTTALT